MDTLETPRPDEVVRVAIVGRPNVGKSSLFNRMCDHGHSLVHDLPGVTRDRLYGNVYWEGVHFEVIDTGGLEPGADEPLKASMEKQVEIAISEAAMILFVTDGSHGVTPLDSHIARLLHKKGKPVLLVVNKIDDQAHAGRLGEFYELGLGDPVGVSATHGRNSGDLLSAVVGELRRLERAGGEKVESTLLKVTVVGKPNAGKSTLINTLLKEDRLLVDARPGTTRDAVEVDFAFGESRYRLVDTAGLRHRAKIVDPLEQIAAAQTVRALKRSHLAILLLDATRELDTQDKRIAGLIQEHKRPCVIAVNKWDAIENKDKERKRWLEDMEEGLFFLQYCPKVFISGQKGTHLGKLMATVDRVAEGRYAVTSPSKLTEMVREASMLHSPPARSGRRLAIYYVTQLKNRMATFVFHINQMKLVDATYQRYIENVFRTHLGYEGIPFTFVFKAKPARKRDRRPAEAASA